MEGCLDWFDRQQEGERLSRPNQLKKRGRISTHLVLVVERTEIDNTSVVLPSRGGFETAPEVATRDLVNIVGTPRGGQ